MPIFRVKSVKIYTGQKNLHWRRRWRRWQLWGMNTFYVLLCSGLQQCPWFIVRVRSRAQVSQSISQQVEHCRHTKSQISFPVFVFTLEEGALHMNLISGILLQLLFFGQTQGKHFLVEVAGNASLQEGHHGNKGNGETGDYYYGNSYVKRLLPVLKADWIQGLVEAILTLYSWNVLLKFFYELTTPLNYWTLLQELGCPCQSISQVLNIGSLFSSQFTNNFFS